MGLDWSKLKKTLNPKFSWDSAVGDALKSTDSLEDVCFSYFAIELKVVKFFKLVIFCLGEVWILKQKSSEIKI